MSGNYLYKSVEKFILKQEIFEEFKPFSMD
jgi:hypothetical protein